MQTPTILIGLGGTGSEIVDKIYSWLPEERQSLVAIHAFDTDVNDIQKLKHLKKNENITQTSTALTVGQYLSIADDGVKEWFPHEVKELHRKTLTDGAGQIRVVSRLAYRAAIEKNALDKLQNSIANINRLRQDNTITNVRVMIVGTLAGGTGSGIFLQTAMYIRELFRTNFNMENILIRGAFLLPDTLILNNTVDGNEFDNLRSNAYASMKELNGIYRSICENNHNTQIEMEYKPNQIDDYGRKNLTLSFDNLPYDYCVLFDFENEDGRNINTFENYKQMVARNTYFDLFTPMSDTLFSRQDNQIRNLVKENGLTRFCASGMATLSYPYNDIVKYHSLKWVSSFLSEHWLAIDKKVENERRDYENDIDKGINREDFVYGQRFIKNVDELKNEKAFFKRVFREVNIIDDRNSPIKFKSEAYIDAIYDEIESLCNSDDNLTSHSRKCDVREDDLKDKRTIIKEISRLENELKEYKGAIESFIQNNKTLLSDKLLTNDARQIIEMGISDNFTEYNCNQKFQINYWILNADAPINPISARYILYQSLNTIKLEIGILEKDVNNLEIAIDNYEKKAYDLLETEKIETAEDRARMAMKQGVLNKLISANEYKLFVEDYIENSTDQQNSLNNFKFKKMKLEVLQNLYITLKDLSNDFEQYFKILSNIKTKISNEQNHLAQIHQEHNDPSVQFCFATQETKEKQWEEIRGVYVDEGIPTDISKQIYMSLFNRLCKRKGGMYTSSNIREESIEANFRKTVVKWCTNRLYEDERLNISIFEAIKAEAESTDDDENVINDHIKNRIQTLNVLAKPYTLNPLGINTANISAWGINPLVNDIFTGSFINEVFAGGDEIIKHDAFSKYEIVKERVLYGLKAEDLTKFREPEGAYYRAYARMLNSMQTNSNEITPHLDKRWHFPAYLPSLSNDGIVIEVTKINKAFITGLIMGYLVNIDYNGTKTWCFKDNTKGIEIINISPDQPVGVHSYQLHEALQYNPAIVDKVLQKYENDIEIQRTSLPDLHHHTFYNGAQKILVDKNDHNILQLIFSYPDDKPSDQELEEKSYELLKATCGEIKKYFLFAIGEHRRGDVQKEILAFVDEMKNNARHYKEANNSNIQSARLVQWNSILNNNVAL